MSLGDSQVCVQLSKAVVFVAVHVGVFQPAPADHNALVNLDVFMQPKPVKD